ncbi:MAG: YraN family protein [Fastidiosipilaceae bacterium]|jgi:Holliday junction resolvase-like predicted endonuclease
MASSDIRPEETVAKGRLAERLTADLFRQNGFSVLARNYVVHRTGEIDLILNRGDTLYVVEVKSVHRNHARSDYDPLEKIGRLKCARLREVTQIYLSRHRLTQFYVQLLAVSIHLSAERKILDWRCVTLDNC